MSDRLRRIEAVTDTALAHLDVEDLLTELLDRVRDLLDVDTAAVLLFDPTARVLVATAARGIEEEVRQGVRIPLGKGFAGRIATEKRPVITEKVDHAHVLNPILRDKGIHSLLGVPLLIGSTVIGVLHVGTLSTRHFTDEDSLLLQLVADRVALATHARTMQIEQAVATTLQRSLLPAELPTVPGLEFAARYVAGGDGEVGGDWYDVFGLPSGWLCIVVGDVVGRGLCAAATMGRLRSALRAYALECTDPAHLLDKLDQQMRHFEPDTMATVLCAMVEPSCEQLHLSSAGHPPPVSVRPGLPAAVLELPIDLPAGVDAGRPRHTSTMAFPPGTDICLYTDGLIERRGSPLDAGLERLRRSVFAGPAESVCAAVMSELLGADHPIDDVAVLVLRRQDRAEMGPLHLRMPAVPVSLGLIRAAVRRWLTGTGADTDEIAGLLVAVGEACANVVEHAYGPGGGTVDVHMTIQPPDVVATIRDTGRWRAPRGQVRGRGITLMRGLSDDVRIEQTGAGTHVVIRAALASQGPR
ncbi:ATP-binding SpoIIE family protein phosphatase [Pseudonocardia bannensis]|uniref:SpoIIE family protein phosphatase n=1 Tax=Pseudonocardia bannensis TaxID=630973 RepID=A0A848DDT0_9PSEU|nr:SpoIIE family protein phosphatase [Pseudonocardia bannensis]NMH90770.1 SpoIIE family protein phosphatase [Pseudonocardia bannensis]